MDVSMVLEVVKPRICWGVKASGSARLRCGEEVNDPRITEEVMKLINEFLSRVEKHRSVLLSDLATPFDNAINALNDWLSRIAVDDGDKNITRLRKAMLDVGKRMLKLAERAREKWLEVYRQELEELISKLGSGGARVIITGEPLNKDKSFMAHLYTDGLAIEIARVAKSGSITVDISLTGLKGVDTVVPRLFSGNKLRAMQCGLLLTDGAIDEEGYPMMGTSQLWQVFAWLLAWPGKNHMWINGLGLNDGDVSIKWHLMALDHKGVFESKAEVAEAASRLDNEEFPTFTLYAVLGDGYVNVKEKKVRLTMGSSKLELWGGLIERLENLGFRMNNDYRRAVTYTVTYSKAIELARKMLGDSMIKALIEDLSQLLDAEKLGRLIELAGMEPKPLGHSSIEVAGVRMNVHVNNNGTVELRTKRKGLEDAVAILEGLKRAGYDAGLRPSGGDFEIYMGMREIKKDPELVTKVCEVLRRMHEEATNKGRERRVKAIARAMARLSCPAQGPRT
ncbi:hypothetical protein JCM16161A_07020 [Vulcanisaeta sp. JCM 16161]|uniref:hypothetical protein n=1 Tax=Vulcanisaeta sp. JCM 16161 TaxID=1295372 RepID=UPI00406D39BD